MHFSPAMAVYCLSQVTSPFVLSSTDIARRARENRLHAVFGFLKIDLSMLERGFSICFVAGCILFSLNKTKIEKKKPYYIFIFHHRGYTVDSKFLK